jgi:replicative DNA helicase
MAPLQDTGDTPNKQRKTKLCAVSPSRPCPVCNGDHKCSTGADGLVICGRSKGHVDGFEYLGPAKKDPEFALYRSEGDEPCKAGPSKGGGLGGPAIDWGQLAESYQHEETESDEYFERLLTSLRIPPGLFRPAFFEPLSLLGVGWNHELGCWTLPEKDARGEVIGINRRYPDGKKRAHAGGRRGLSYTGLHDISLSVDHSQATGPILIPEGFSDVLVLEALGIPTIGRPSNAGGVEFLLEILAPLPADWPIIVVAENDQKEDGSWPGRDGAVGTATQLVHGLARPVRYAFPPGAKDIRDWFLDQDLGDPGGADWAATRERLRDGLLEALLASARLEPVWEAGWEEPLPFHDVALPAFPVEALAPWQRAFVKAEATATQTPPDLPAMLVLSVTSVACARKFVVKIKDGYVEPVNIYTATGLPPASRKSAVFRDVKEPVETHERELAKGTIPEIAAARAQHEIDDRTLTELYKKAAKAEGPERDALVQQAGELAQELAEAEIPRAVRLLADDTTPERLEILLAENGDRMGVLSAEGGVFDIMAGRYAGKGRSGNFEIFLKGHAGDDLRVDRVGRAPVFIRQPALTLGLAVQPEVIRSLGAIPGSRGRGLLGRFLYAMPPSIVGRRVVDPPHVPQAVRQTYLQKMEALLKLSAGKDQEGAPAGTDQEGAPAGTDQEGAPAGTDQEGEPAERVLTLAEPAYSCWLEFAAWVEPRLADFGALADMADWAGKLPGAVARLAGLLHLANCVGESAPCGTPIPANTMARAISIGRYLIPHARAAFDMMGLDPLVADAQYVLAWIRRQAAGPVGFEFSKRDAFEGTKGRFKQVTDLELALGLLEKHHYIRMLPAEPRSGRGRPPSPTYEVNPLAFDASDHPLLGNPAPISANSANSANPGELQNAAADLISANSANSASSNGQQDEAADLISANSANSASSNGQQDEAPTPEPDGEEEGYEEEVI